MKYKTIRSEIKYQGKAFSVRQDQVELPEGRQAALDIVVHPGAVTLVPVDSEGRIWFVRQYRHASGEELLELPAGTLNSGEAPEVCAHREIREEIGMAAGKLEKLGEFFLAPGYSTEHMHIYLATDLRDDPLEGDEDEFLSVETVPAAEVFRMASDGEIRDAKSLAALALARARLMPLL